MKIYRQRTYTQYDDADRLKQMKDSDILAEKKKSAPGMGGVIAGTAAGVGAGAAIGTAVGLFKKTKPETTKKFLWMTKKSGPVTRGMNIRSGAKTGAIIGGVALAANALSKRSKEAKATDFYNSRLEYAQYQAKRREKKDWKQNMTQRDGYSY